MHYFNPRHFVLTSRFIRPESTFQESNVFSITHLVIYIFFYCTISRLLIIRDAAVALNAPGNESCNSQHFLGEVTSVTSGQWLASHCYCFDPANPKPILMFYLHPANPKEIRIQSRIRSRLLRTNRRCLKRLCSHVTRPPHWRSQSV